MSFWTILVVLIYTTAAFCQLNQQDKIQLKEDCKIDNNTIDCSNKQLPEVIRQGEQNFPSNLIDQPESILELKLENSAIKVIYINEDYTNLESLIFSNNVMEKFDLKDLKDFEKLKMINLSYNKISDFGQERGFEFENLFTIDLSHNCLTKLDIDKLPAVKVVVVSDNKLEALPTVGNTIRRLEVANNSIDQVEEVYFEDKLSLQYLDVSLNSLSSIANLSSCTNLTVVLAAGNKLDCFPDFPKSIERIDLSDNFLEDLPFSFESFTKLKVLNLKNNKLIILSSLPQYVVELNLAGNQLNETKAFEKLTVIDKINLERNIITRISNLTKLHKLRTLNIADNQIKQFSTENLPVEIEELDLSQNKLSNYSFIFFLDKKVYLKLKGNDFPCVCSAAKALEKRSNVNLSKCSQGNSTVKVTDFRSKNCTEKKQSGSENDGETDNANNSGGSWEEGRESGVNVGLIVGVIVLVIVLVALGAVAYLRRDQLRAVFYARNEPGSEEPPVAFAKEDSDVGSVYNELYSTAPGCGSDELPGTSSSAMSVAIKKSEKTSKEQRDAALYATVNKN